MGINKKQAMEDDVEDHSSKYEQHLLESNNALGYDNTTTGISSFTFTTPISGPQEKKDYEEDYVLTEEYIIRTLEAELKELKEKQARSEQREREILQILSKLKPLKQMETLNF